MGSEKRCFLFFRQKLTVFEKNSIKCNGSRSHCLLMWVNFSIMRHAYVASELKMTVKTHFSLKIVCFNYLWVIFRFPDWWHYTIFLYHAYVVNINMLQQASENMNHYIQLQFSRKRLTQYSIQNFLTNVIFFKY